MIIAYMLLMESYPIFHVHCFASFQNGSHFYKNSLQELTQNEGFFLPKYKTKKSGEPHNPTFFSTVEVEGETFRGAAAKSKKQAESNAAKAAYTALMESKWSFFPYLCQWIQNI